VTGVSIFTQSQRPFSESKYGVLSFSHCGAPGGVLGDDADDALPPLEPVPLGVVHGGTGVSGAAPEARPLPEPLHALSDECCG
jgi:hypothetical protein